MTLSPAPGRDRPILPLTRWVAAGLTPFLLTAGLLLYTWPDRTGELFAWTIASRLTPLIMGAGYLSGTYFFLRVARGSRWEEVRLGFLPIAAFAGLSAVFTLLHWDRFNHEHLTFYAWVFLYAVSPLLVLAVWVLNERAGGNPQSDSAGPAEAAKRFAGPGGRFPSPAAWALGGVGALLVAAGLALFLAPGRLIPAWPWQLTPLTARTLGTWFVLPGLVDLSLAGAFGKSSTRVTLESQLIGLGLLLIGIVRAWSDLAPANPLAWGFTAGIAGLFLGMLALYGRLLAWR